MTGVIDVGGGLRDIYGAGVLDYCLDNGVAFDACTGVSAGSANVASYLAGQRKRNYKFFMEYTFRRQYMSLSNLLFRGSYINLDYIYSGLTNSDGEYPLDYDTFTASPAAMTVVSLNALTGETIYFDKSYMKRDSYHVCKASSALPVVCKPYFIDGVPCFDGGLADPVPVQKALDDGCDKVVLILTRPLDFVREQKKDVRMSNILRKRYPKAAERLLMRYKTYNDSVALAKRYAAEGKVLIIAPDDCCGMKTLTKSREKMEQMYQKGYRDAQAIPAFVRGAKQTQEE